MKSRTLFSFLTCAFLTLNICSTAEAAVSWNAATDFNATTNQSGAWSYGWESSIGGPFVASTAKSFELADAWAGANGSLIFHNPTTNVLTPGGTIYLAPGAIAEHPGLNGEFTVVRWTAPQAGSYALDAGFFGISQSGEPTTTDVHILKNGTSFFDGLVEGHWAGDNFRVGPSGLLNFSIESNDTIDFVVGRGRNENYYFDSTRLDATISEVPEPESLLMMLTGLGLVGFMARRRKAS